MMRNKMKPWDKFISDNEKKAYRAAGFGRKGGIGVKPVLLIIDVQYRTTGNSSKLLFDLQRHHRTVRSPSWRDVESIADVQELMRFHK